MSAQTHFFRVPPGGAAGQRPHPPPTGRALWPTPCGARAALYSRRNMYHA